MYVIVNGKSVPVEQFEGCSVDDERAAYARHKARGLAHAGIGSGERSSSMISGEQLLGGDPRKARKRFRFTPG